MPPSIPDDLHHEILVRLPAKSVGRSRCVSKRCLSLTTDPRFIKAHSSNAPIVTSGFYLYNSFAHKAELFVPLNGYNESLPSHSPLSFLRLGGSQAKIIHSCNGLILCRESDKIGRLLSVCNPTTREHVVIRVPKNVEPSEFSLAFDPPVSPNFKVFGLINKSAHGRPLYSVYRFSSENPSWELLYDNVNNADGYFLSRRSAFWNGHLCWMGKDWVHCLDVESKQMSRLRLPQLKSAETRGYFGVSEGRLHCVVKNWNTCYAVYQLESSSTSTRWSLLHGVDLGGIEYVYPEARRKQGGRSSMKVIGFLCGGGDEVGDRLLLSIPNMVVVYHFNDQGFSICCRLPTYGKGEFPHFGIYIHPLACTLSPLNASTSHKNWLCWKSEHDTLLIRLLVENSLKGQKTVHGFKEHAWDDMVEKFNETTKLNYAVNHLKDRFASYRHDYRLMNKLLKYKGFYWNPEKQMLIASDADWKRRQALVIHKGKQVPFRDFEIIFASSTTECHKTNERACISKDRDNESPQGTQNSLTLKRKKR